MLLGWLGAEIGEPEIAIRTKARAGLGALFGDEADAVLAPLGGLLRLRIDTAAVPDEEVDRRVRPLARASRRDDSR